MCRIFIYSLVLKNRKGVRAHMTNKYDFNAYDTAIALILTRYLSSTGEVKKELSRVRRGNSNVANTYRFCVAFDGFAQEVQD